METTYTQNELNAMNILQFSAIAYRDHDAAHNIDHAKNVLEIMWKILDPHKLTPREVVLIDPVALLHDALDHKFVAMRQMHKDSTVKLGLEEHEISAYLAHNYGADAAEIMRIHRNCSWSNRGVADRYGKYSVLHKLLEDADWICAIDLERCIEYTTDVHTKRGIDINIIEGADNIRKDVTKHINEKLLQIRPNLHSEAARKYVVEHNLEAPLKEFVLQTMATFK